MSLGRTELEIFNVYPPPERERREALLRKLAVYTVKGRPQITAGNFSCITEAGDRKMKEEAVHPGC